MIQRVDDLTCLILCFGWFCFIGGMKNKQGQQQIKNIIIQEEFNSWIILDQK